MPHVAWATLLANIGIILTGGAVRLTGSGLGCPTWPRCTEDSFVPTGELQIHSAIEFGNRLLTFVLTAVAIATLVVVWRSSRPDLRRLAVVLAVGIPLQAAIGGITVLTGLNPWTVGVHLVVSLAMVSLATLMLWRLDHPVPDERPGAMPRLALATYAAAWAVLVVGTVVTGSGPHAGDADVARNGLDPLQLSQVHADLVFLLVGLTVACVLVSRGPVRAAALALLAVELAQGVVGFVQYFRDLPIVLVELHLLGAALVAVYATRLLLVAREVRPDEPATERVQAAATVR
ncbi:COX15/CtaA family protein [Nocardioidaceae bacterium]|nr:COX15/CtaA family protein [Nocardioidaceae bacterium]